MNELPSCKLAVAVATILTVVLQIDALLLGCRQCDRCRPGLVTRGSVEVANAVEEYLTKAES